MRFWVWAALVLPACAQVSVVEQNKGVEPPVAPQSPQSVTDSPSTTLAPVAQTTTAPGSPDISAILATLSYDLTASQSSVDTSAIFASLSSQYLATLAKTTASSPTLSNSKSTSSSSSLVTPSSPSSSTTNPSSKDGIGSPDRDLKDHRTLIIVLAVLLSIFILTLIIFTFMLLRRYRRGQCPFSRLSKRGASPIDDDEIATWRTNPASMAQTSHGGAHNHTRTASSIIFSPSPGHSWTVHSLPNTPSPVFIPPSQNSDSSTQKCQTQTPNQTHSKSFSRGSSRTGGRRSAEQVQEPAALVARAPNSRSGLTDETVPGADPFLPPLKRQSTRLSKANSPGHARAKSRRSSRGSIVSNGLGSATFAGNGNASTPSMGRFSFDRVESGRSRSFSGGLGMNPFVNGKGNANTNPFAANELENVGPGGLWPPPKRKMSFPEGMMVGVAS